MMAAQQTRVAHAAQRSFRHAARRSASRTEAPSHKSASSDRAPVRNGRFPRQSVRKPATRRAPPRNRLDPTGRISLRATDAVGGGAQANASARQ